MRAAALVFATLIYWAPAAGAQTATAADSAQSKREQALKMPEIIRAMGLTEGSKAADIGAGEGYYEPPMSRTVRAGGRLVIVDMTPHKTLSRPRADQVKNHVIAPDLVDSEVRAAGFQVVSRDDHFIDRPDEESTRWMIVARKPGN